MGHHTINIPNYCTAYAPTNQNQCTNTPEYIYLWGCIKCNHMEERYLCYPCHHQTSMIQNLLRCTYCTHNDENTIEYLTQPIPTHLKKPIFHLGPQNLRPQHKP